MEVTESTQRHTRVRLKQIELVLFTLCDGSFVFCDVAAEISAQIMVRRQITRSICRIGPVVGIGLLVGSTLVASPTYEPQHYKTNKITCAPSEDRSTRASAITMGSWGPNLSSCGQRRLWSDWADVQADLSLRWAQRSLFWSYGGSLKASHTVKRS